MEYRFKVKNDRIILLDCNRGVSGNANSYICTFEIECAYPGLDWFCVFKRAEVYCVPITDGKCVIPHEVLSESGMLQIGVYGTDENPEGPCRVSTNLLNVSIESGGYTEDAAESVAPSSDSWELFVNSKLEPRLEEIDSAEEGRKTAEAERAAAEEKRQSDTETAIQDAAAAVKDCSDSAQNASEAAASANTAAENANTAAQGANSAAEDARAAAASIDIPAIVQEVTENVTETILYYEQNLGHLLMGNRAEIRCGEMDSILIEFPETIPADYISSLVFTSGAEPVQFTYPDTIKWCGNYVIDGSFVPSSNKRYDISFFYDGVNIVGVVGGYPI